MLNFKRRDRRTKLEKEIDSILERLSKISPASKRYTVIVENLEKLCKAQSYEKPRRVTPDTKLIVAGSLIGTILIIGYEQLGHVITSKAFGTIIKGRV